MSAWKKVENKKCKQGPRTPRGQSPCLARVTPAAPGTPGRGRAVMPSPAPSLLSEFDIYEDAFANNHVQMQQLEGLTSEVQKLKEQLDTEQNEKTNVVNAHAALKGKYDNAVKELHSCMVAGKRAVALKHDQLVRLKAAKQPPPCCPNCCTVLNKPAGIPKPRRVKVLGAKNCVEVYFSNYNHVKAWCRGYGLITNTDGLPVLPEDLSKQEQVRQAKSLEDVDSLISKKPVTATSAEPSTSGANSNSAGRGHSINANVMKPPAPPTEHTRGMRSGNNKKKAIAANLRNAKPDGVNAIPLQNARVFGQNQKDDKHNVVEKPRTVNIATHEIPQFSRKRSLSTEKNSVDNQMQPSTSRHINEPTVLQPTTPSNEYNVPKFDDSFKIPKKASKRCVQATPQKASPLERVDADRQAADDSRVRHERAKSIVRNARRPTPSPAVMTEQRQRLIREYSVEPSKSFPRKGAKGSTERPGRREREKRHRHDSARDASKSRRRSISPPTKRSRTDDNDRCGRRRDSHRVSRRRAEEDRVRTRGERKDSYERRKCDGARAHRRDVVEAAGRRGHSQDQGDRRRSRQDDRRSRHSADKRRRHVSPVRSRERGQSREKSRSHEGRHSQHHKSKSRERLVQETDACRPQVVTSPKKDVTVHRDVVEPSGHAEQADAIHNEQVELSPHIPSTNSTNKEFVVTDDIEDGEVVDEDVQERVSDRLADVKVGNNRLPVSGCQSPNTSHVSQVSLQLSPSQSDGSRPNSNLSAHIPQGTAVISSRNSSHEQVVSAHDLSKGFSIELGSEDSDDEEGGMQIHVVQAHNPSTTGAENESKGSPFKLVLNSELTQSSCDDVVKRVLQERKQRTPASAEVDFTNLTTDKKNGPSVGSILAEMTSVSAFLSPIEPKERKRVAPLEAAIDDIYSWSIVKCAPEPHHRDETVPPMRIKRYSHASHTSSSSICASPQSPVKSRSPNKVTKQLCSPIPPKITPIKNPKQTAAVIPSLAQVSPKISPIKNVQPVPAKLNRPIARPLGSKLKAMMQLEKEKEKEKMEQEIEQKEVEDKLKQDKKEHNKGVKTKTSSSGFSITPAREMLKSLWKKK